MVSSPKTASQEGYLKDKFKYFHLRDTAGQERDFHFHEFDKIVILISGKVNYAVENNLYTLNPWDVLLVRHHTIHKAIIDKSVPYERIIVYLEEPYFSSVLPEAGLTECFFSADEKRNYLIPANEEIRNQVGSLVERYEAVSGSGRLENAMRETVIMQLLIVLNALSGPLPAAAKSAHNDKLEKVLSYINTNISEDLNIDDLAGIMYMSRYHFMRVFKENVGCTVHEYVRQRRLLHASRLIREGMDSAAAAEKSGFGDYSSFYRAFKSTFGVSPRSLKRKFETGEQ